MRVNLKTQGIDMSTIFSASARTMTAPREAFSAEAVSDLFFGSLVYFFCLRESLLWPNLAQDSFSTSPVFTLLSTL